LKMTVLEKRVSEFVSSIEIAKKRCMAGILRAQNITCQQSCLGVDHFNRLFWRGGP